MNFELTEEQQQIKASVREFAESEIRPHVMEWDETQHFPRRTATEARGTGFDGRDFPGRIWRRGNGLRRIRDDYRRAGAR
jgi:alkylation response protein AidB-like acyl-CoA dehydrogenase